MTLTWVVASGLVLHHLTPSYGHGVGPDTGGARHSPIGQPGEPSRVTMQIDIDMTDQMRFDPSSLTVTEGSTVRFKIHNKGALVHEFVLGTEHDLVQHNEAMKSMPGMAHNGASMVTLKPGANAQIIWEFTRPGILLFGCLQPGHYDAGMLGAVTVVTGL